MPRLAFQRPPASALSQLAAMRAEVDQLSGLVAEIGAHAERLSVRMELLLHSIEEDRR
jgi:hypothetical protein